MHPTQATRVIAKRVLVAGLAVMLLGAPWVCRPVRADNAEVLPKGVFRTGVQGKIYLPVDERYDPDGDAEDVAADFNASLDSNVFPALALVEAGFGLPEGSATIGDSVVSFEYHFRIVEFNVAYGLTDRLSLGVMIPYWWVENDVTARVDSTNATVGRNPLFGTDQDPFGSPIIPLSMGGVPFTTEEVQTLLGPGLPGIPGFGFDPIEDWSDSGLSDIEAGLKFQYLKTESWRLALAGGVRFPTGELDDPDNLQDYAFGTGAYALLFRLNNDFVGFQNWVLGLTLRYDLVLADEQTRRVPDDVDKPLTTNKEKVSRNLGDVFEFEPSVSYTPWKGFSLSCVYKYGAQLTENDVDGDQGFDYSSLEKETDYTEQVINVGVSYSTIPLYREKKFKVPLVASFGYRNRFAGSNNSLKSQYFGLGLDVFF